MPKKPLSDQNWGFHHVTVSRPDSSVGRASAFRAGGRGFESRPHHIKGVKMVRLAVPLLTLAK